MEFTLQAFVVTGVNSARSSPPLRGIFPPRGELPSREASSPANILAGTTQTNKVLRGGKGKSRPTGCLWGGCVGYNNSQGKIPSYHPAQKSIPGHHSNPPKIQNVSPVRTTHSQNKSYPPILMKRSTPYPRVYLKSRPKTAKQYPPNTQKANHHSMIFFLPLGQKGFILVYEW